MKTPKEIQVSPHFTLHEVYYSDKAHELSINNMPVGEELITCVRTAGELERVRVFLSSPVKVNSWYRSPLVNQAVGSKSTSQHLVGEAVDFTCVGFGSPEAIVKTLQASHICYDQLILEHSWVHISFAIRTGLPRRQVLSLLSNGSYATGITDLQGNPL